MSLTLSQTHFTPHPFQSMPRLPYEARLQPVGSFPPGWKGKLYVVYKVEVLDPGGISDGSTPQPVGAIDYVCMKWLSPGGMADVNGVDEDYFRKVYAMHPGMQKANIHAIVGVYGVK